jgi:hypothetical protein
VNNSGEANMPIPDPFRNDDPLWQPFQLTPSSADFAQPDTASRDLGDFLREAQKAIAASRPAPPPRQRHRWTIATAPSF